MITLRSIALVLLTLSPLTAQDPQQQQATGESSSATQQAPESNQKADEGHGSPAKSTMEMGDSEFFIQQFSHTVPHLLWQPEISPDPEINRYFAFYDVNQFQLITIVLVFVVFMLVLGSFGSGQTPWIIRIFRGWCLWLRDEVVYAVMGREEGKVYAPYFIFLFFFITFGNLISIIPGSVTMSATIFVTGALSLLTFAMMLVGGMLKQGPGKFWITLLPPHLPLWVIPLMVVIELMSLIVKPFALTLRLFANMLAGHLIIASFIGMIFLFAKIMDMGWLSWATAVPALAMAIFIFVIESFVAILQAYIFTYLSIIFVQQALHPAH